MKLFQSILIILTIWCLFQCQADLQTNQETKLNGTKTFGLNGRNKNKAETSHPADYNLCGRSSQSTTKASIADSDASLGDWPWMALIGYIGFNRSTVFKCEAILISRQWVLSPAHCVQNIGPFSIDSVRLGAVKVDKNHDRKTVQDFQIDKIIVHPEYIRNYTGRFNNLALIRLKVPVNYTENIRPICLLNEPKFKEINELYKEKDVYLVGYDSQIDYETDNSLELRRRAVEIVNQTECARRYAKLKFVLIDERVICVTTRSGHDVCEYILGGAIFFQNSTEQRFYLGGVTSFQGSACYIGDVPHAFTKVAHFIDWIIQVTGEKFL